MDNDGLDDEVLRIRSEAAVSREVDGEMVVLDLKAGKYLGTNGSGKLLWRAMTDGATREQLAETLVQAYRIGRPQADEAVTAFVDVCRSRGFLHE